MNHGIFLSVAETVAILVAVLVLAFLSSLVYLRTDEVPERRSLVLFWGCLAVTWLVAAIAAVTMPLTL
jgi:hypothetical protein